MDHVPIIHSLTPQSQNHGPYPKQRAIAQNNSMDALVIALGARWKFPGPQHRPQIARFLFLGQLQEGPLVYRSSHMYFGGPGRALDWGPDLGFPAFDQLPDPWLCTALKDGPRRRPNSRLCSRSAALPMWMHDKQVGQCS